MKMQTILGSGGAIGSHLAKELSHYTQNIRLVSRNPKKVNEFDQLFAFDLTKRNYVYHSIEGSEIVYVTIGFPYRSKIWEKNWPYFIHNLINACKLYHAKLVFFDNMYMYDKNHLSHMDELTPVNACSRKGKVRETVARMITDEIVAGNLEAIIARAPDFIGMHNSVIGQIVIQNLKAGKSAMWFCNANKIHNYIYTPDAAKATAILGNTPDAFNQVWHLPSIKEKLTGSDWVQLIADSMNKEAKLNTLPKAFIGLLGLFMPVMRELKEMVYQYELDYYFDSSKFEKRFDYIPISAKDVVLEVLNQNVIR